MWHSLVPVQGMRQQLVEALANWTQRAMLKGSILGYKL
ncbi:MAG: hypothetical protein ACJAUC_003194 [Planctomycetota bacterium]